MELMEIEAIVAKVKSLGVSEEEILSVQRHGKPLSSAKIVCEMRSNLQTAARTLYAAAKKGQQGNTANNCATPVQHGIPGRSRGQSSVTQHGLTPQQQIQSVQQQQQRGGPACTPHQFGLTPFQSIVSCMGVDLTI